MPSLLARVVERAEAAGIGKRLHGCWKFLRYISCYTFSLLVIIIVGSVFFVFGIATVAPRNEDTNPEIGWIFFGLGLILIISAVAGFFGRYLCHRSNQSSRQRPGPRPVRTRPGGRRTQVHPTRSSQAPQVWTSPVPQSAVASPVSETERSTSNASTPSSITVERRLSVAPPTYDEAIGVNRQSIVTTEPPPYNLNDTSQINSC